VKSQNFGIELEMTGLTRAASAKIIAGHFGTQATHIGGAYDTYTVQDGGDRRWKIVSCPFSRKTEPKPTKISEINEKEGAKAGTRHQIK